MFGTFLINPKTKEKYDLRPGEVKKLENGTEIQAFISRGSNNKIIFEDLKSIRISQEDLLNAIKKLAKQKETAIKTLSHI